jgi:cell division protein FtsQ
MTQTIGSTNNLLTSRLRRKTNPNADRGKQERKSPTPFKKRVMVIHERDVPVMVRGRTYAAPSSEGRKRNKVRRRYDVALDIPGAEVRLPALPVIHIGWRLISFMLAIILGGGIYFAWTSPLFIVQKAEVRGLQRLNERDVNAVLDMAGDPIFMTNPQKMKAKLIQAFPELISADIQVKLPNIVEVTIVERSPILVWRQDGKSVLVDANGYAFPLRETTSAQPSLIVEASTGPAIDIQSIDPTDAQMRFLPVEMVSGILSMNALVPDRTPIVYDAKHGLGWKDKRGWEVYFGDARDMDLKLKVYMAVVKKLKAEKITPTLISVEYIRAPYYRLER